MPEPADRPPTSASAAGAVPPARVEIVRVSDHHDEGLAEFFRAVWDPQATAARVRAGRRATAAANPIAPGEEPPTFICLAGSQVLGYVTSIPLRLWSDGRPMPAHWLKGLMVLPDYRNGPIGYYLLKETISHLGIALSLAAAPPALRLFGGLGFADLGCLFNAVRILKPSRVLRQLDVETLGFSGVPRSLTTGLRLVQATGLAPVIGPLMAGVMRLWISLCGGSSLQGSSSATRVPDELDGLWQLARDQLQAAPVRDGQALLSRYGSETGAYHAVTVRDQDNLVAFAAVRPPRDESDPRLRGLHVATVSDILFPLNRPNAGLAALAAAETVARRLQADILVCSGSHPRLGAILRRQGYLRVPGNIHFLVRNPAKDGHLPSNLSDWWLTRGDSNADEIF